MKVWSNNERESGKDDANFSPEEKDCWKMSECLGNREKINCVVLVE